MKTATGSTAIDRLRVGDVILSENPTSGKVEPERIQAVIDDGVKPLIALDLSDGSTLRVTASHAFWVDGGSGLRGAGWLEAGQLQPGDHLRTVRGAEVMVLRVRWNVGNAEVYTLTVATDHTFFVGSDGVLVHNAGGLCNVMNGAAAETYLRYITGGRSVRLVALVNGQPEVRVIDSLTASGAAYESKLGRIGLDSFIRNKIAKDVYLRSSGQINGATWVFFRSPITGAIGPTRGLRALLVSSGIDIKLIPDPISRLYPRIAGPD
ncbi:MAG TPA: polymorphic toxin-type HINT domain-containing protein [Candidatus Nanopelagicaceae bacterium]|nr:polymorphic toxin-type HINT domain-containing protein [Candidatus Nanopelagicaceae bacterium]